jgi:hypothetical protein
LFFGRKSLAGKSDGTYFGPQENTREKDDHGRVDREQKIADDAKAGRSSDLNDLPVRLRNTLAKTVAITPNSGRGIATAASVAETSEY